MYRSRDHSCDEVVLADITRATFSSLLQIVRRRPVKNCATEYRWLCQMEITRHLIFIVILHLSVFYCHANVTSVKVSGFRQPAVKLLFSVICCLGCLVHERRLFDTWICQRAQFDSAWVFLVAFLAQLDIRNLWTLRDLADRSFTTLISTAIKLK